MPFPTHRVASMLLAALTLAACDEDDRPLRERRDAFEWHGPIAAGATVRVRDMNGDISVEPSPDTLLHITADIAWRRGDPDATLAFSANEVGGDVLVCAVWGEGKCTADEYTSNFDFGRRVTDAKVHFRVQVPSGVRLDLRGVNGDIRAAASAPVEARTTNGDIVVATAVGPVRGETTSGDVDLRMSTVSGTDSIVARSMSGDVYVFLPDGIAAAVDLSTAGGSVSTEFPVAIIGEPSRRRLHGTLGAGTHKIRLSTMAGDAALRRLDAEGRSAAP